MSRGSKYHAKINQRRWAVVRRAVLDRDGWRCVSCGAAGALEVDHIVPLHREPGQNPFDLENLQTLCRGCHVHKSSEERRPTTDGERRWRAMVLEMIG